jgi:hypothetical protein
LLKIRTNFSANLSKVSPKAAGLSRIKTYGF